MMPKKTSPSNMRFIATAFSLLLSLTYLSDVRAQAIDPNRSARAAAASDAQFIAANIEYDEDVMFLARQALERATDSRVKELAQQMQSDHTQMLYSMQQLNTAAGKSDQPAKGQTGAAAINDKLTAVSGFDFDTTWVGNMLILQQAKYDEFTAAKETVTNPQLKMAVAEGIPLLRKQLTQLRSIQKYLIRMDIQQKKEAEQQRKQAELEKKRSRK
jgi:predicted outer membrane protein